VCIGHEDTHLHWHNGGVYCRDVYDASMYCKVVYEGNVYCGGAYDECVSEVVYNGSV
jgi:hypothetical protein